MKKLIFVLLGSFLGLATGFAVGIFVYPYIFLADLSAADQAPEQSPILATGRFIHVNPSDPVHYGKGMVTVYENTVHLGGDFEVGPGPKFHVYLVPKKPITSANDVKASKFVDLGRLRAFKGSQNYAIPPGVNPGHYGSVVIWCKAFGVLISPAALEHLADQLS
jgi:electron transfer DM13